MKSIKSQIIESTNFIEKPCLEFACSIHMLDSEKNLTKLMKDFNFEIPNEDKKIIEQLKENMSYHLKSEFEYFYDIIPVYIYPGAFITDNDDIKTVSDLLDKMEKADISLVFNYLGGIFISEYEKGLHDKWNNVRKDVDAMKSYIENADIEESTHKDKLLECFNYPKETKQRLCFMFRQFYETSYSKIECEVLEKLTAEKERYLKIFNNSPEEFFKKYLFNYFNCPNGRWDYKIDIQVSIFYQAYFWIMNLHDYIEKRGIVVLGARTDRLLKKLEIKDEVDKFLKAISDKKRIDIIKLLSRKTCYGYAIANELKLTPATVNYHTNFLIEAGIINIERKDNKVMYTLSKEKVRDLFRKTEEILLGDVLK